MTYNVVHQQRLSRGELLLRSFFGWLYIYIPHAFLLFFVGLWAAILSFLAFWIILFTGKYPRSFFDFQVGFLRWQARLNARSFNLVDGYPAFGVNAADPNVIVDIPYPESLSRGMVIVKVFFGWLYVLIPHGFVLIFLSIGMVVAALIGWFAVLITAQMPSSIHNFIVGVQRWATRVQIYMTNMTDTYPPFSLDE